MEKHKEQLNKAIEENAKNAAKSETKAHEALQYTQATLNAAHTLSVLHGIEREQS